MEHPRLQLAQAETQMVEPQPSEQGQFLRKQPTQHSTTSSFGQTFAAAVLGSATRTFLVLFVFWLGLVVLDHLRFR